MPKVGRSDAFETKYMARLRLHLADHGQIVEYEKDRAALDLGLHLYQPGEEGSELEVSSVRVWMQCKGIQHETLSRESIEACGYVPVKNLRTEHIAYWYSAPEPVYLVVYVEAIDAFLTQDVRKLVDQQLTYVNLDTFVSSQKTTLLRLSLTETLDAGLDAMPQHRSIRVDGPQFRGRPLGHSLDPLRSEFNPLPAETFDRAIRDLLDVHEFRPAQEFNARSVFGKDLGAVSVMRGSLLLTYEWTSPLFTEFGFDEGSSFRIESPPMHTQGDVVVIIQSRIDSYPTDTPELRKQVSAWNKEGVARVLVFFNETEVPKLFGAWRVVLGPLCEVPQGCGSITFNVLTTTSVYLKYLDQLSWRLRNYL